MNTLKGCLENPSCDDGQICGANAVCVDTDNGAKCECPEGFFGESNGANGQDCFNNGVFEEMINDIKQIYRHFMDTNIRIGKPKIKIVLHYFCLRKILKTEA